MKIEYLVDFLPPDLRRRTSMRTARRRSLLLLALMSFMVLGVAAHSWNRYRQADIDRNVSMEVCTNSIKVDDVVDKLAADQQSITRFLGVYDHIALPLEVSDLVATVTHLMPDKMSLAMLRFELETEKIKPPESKDGGKPAKAPKAAKGGKEPAKEAAAPEHPRRWLNGIIRGYAASNGDVFDFERRLNKTKPLDAVTVTENKPTEVPGSQLQSFAITFRIPLDARYELTEPAPVAVATPAASTSAPAKRSEIAQ